jgi:hypothetical protein
VRGKICLTNEGSQATENLTIVYVVQVKTGSGEFTDHASTPVDVGKKPVLGPGESGCYGYSLDFTPVPEAQYRNVARVTITNYAGHLGEAFGPEAKADFSLPDTPTVREYLSEADVTDVTSCPNGFTCTPGDPGPWHFTDSGSVSYTMEIGNDAAPCGAYFDLNNTATLTSQWKQLTASATVSIHTGACK